MKDEKAQKRIKEQKKRIDELETWVREFVNQGIAMGAFVIEFPVPPKEKSKDEGQTTSRSGRHDETIRA